MENASKALIIAGGVLIMILLFTLATYLYKGMASQTSEFYSKLEQSDIDEFNHKFLKFNAIPLISSSKLYSLFGFNIIFINS